MECRLLGIPTTAVQIIAVFWQSGKVENAEITASAWPVFIVWSWLAQIVESSPHKLAYNPIFVILKFVVLLWNVTPVAGLKVVT